MKVLQRTFAAAIAFALLVPSINAVCMYRGKLYAKTTVAQEFADSAWVVRVKVVSTHNHWTDEDDPWTIYHLQVMTAFKGKPSTRISMFTYRDSGGFYLDKETPKDFDGEYLLFLNPISERESAPVAAKDATEVNYSCGQSKAWNELKTSERRQLTRLSQMQ